LQEIERLQQDLIRAQQQRVEQESVVSRQAQQMEDTHTVHAQEVTALRRQIEESAREIEALTQRIAEAQYANNRHRENGLLMCVCMW
jgi:hypothetical protein